MAADPEMEERVCLISKSQGVQKRWSKQQWISMIIICAGNFFAGNCLSVQGPFFPKEAELQGASPTEYGLVFAVYQLCVFLTSPICAKLLAVVPPMFILNTGQLFLATTTILFGFVNRSTNVDQFLGLAFALRSFEGIATAAFATSAYSIIVAEFPDRVATTFATIQTFFGVGLIAGPTIGGALYQVGGFSLPFLIIGSCVFVCFILGAFLIRPPEQSTSNGSGQSLVKFWRNPMCLVVSAAIVSNFINIGYNAAVLEPHLRQFRLAPVLVGMLFVVAALVYSFTSPFCGRICDKLDHPELLCPAGLCLQSVYLLLIGPAPFFHIQTELWMVILAMSIFGFGISGVLVPAFTAVLKGTLRRGFSNDILTYGLVSSLFSSSMSLGSFIGPSIGGVLENTVGFSKGTLVLLAINIVVLAIFCGFLFVTRNDRKTPIQSTQQNL